MNELLARKADALKTLARYLGGDYDIKIVYDPKGRMCTNGKRISVPMISDETYDQYEDFLVGGIFHETGHILHTDFDLYKNEKDPVIRTLMNSLDDHRIETFRKEDFKSAAYELNNLYEFVSEKNKKKFDAPGYEETLKDNPTEMLWLVGAAIIYKLNGYDYHALFPKKVVELVDKTEDILDEYKNHLIRDRIEGTAKAHEFAVKLDERLKDHLTKPPSEKDDGKDGDENENENGGEEGGEKGKGEKKGKGKEHGDGDEDANGDKSKKKIKEKIVKMDVKEWEELYKKMKKCKPKELHEDIKREIEEIVLVTTEKSLDRHVPHPKAVEGDREIVPTFSNESKIQKAYHNKKEKVQREIDSMKSKMLSLLMAKKRMHFLPDADHGEIDTASLYSLKDGNKRIFERRAVGKKLNTAVEILIDCSGSMGSDYKWEGAIEAAIACGETLELLKIPFEITGFTTDCHSLSSYPFSREELDSYNRFEPLTHFIFKEFNENFNTVKYRLMKINAKENNGDPESVWWAACRLSRRREQRKILIVMSDGRPAMSFCCDIYLLGRELKKVVKKIMKTGIEVYGIGIYDDAPKNFYPEWSVISKQKGNIASAVYSCLSKKLMNGGAMDEL